MPTDSRQLNISRSARDRFGLDDELFSSDGSLILSSYRVAMVLAQRINQARNTILYPERSVLASHINALGVIDQSLHLLINHYRATPGSDLLAGALDWLERTVGTAKLELVLKLFIERFPPTSLYNNEITSDIYLDTDVDDGRTRQEVLKHLLVHWLECNNPAFNQFPELFDRGILEKDSDYELVTGELSRFLFTLPSVDPFDKKLIEILQGPVLAAPHSLAGQMEFIRTAWREDIHTHIYDLLGGLDFIAEEQKPAFSGPGPAHVPEYHTEEAVIEEEHFSPDHSWMPSVVLLAKNAYVWLDQLATTYDVPVATLADIPDQALHEIADRGITGLWLIGLWERSVASQRIKQLCGNPEAAASAYALREYEIAEDLGGPTAFADLQRRASDLGIRLASDMVPNHMGIDSNWIIDHPDWFISRTEPPYPAYEFTGPDLSEDDGVVLQIEDHYYERTDAAVVFRRHDTSSGDVRYIYHGNDGTVMPWNDTAQLDFLNPEVREAVIQTVLRVARQFPIIRFDAAMTLAKRHFQRLWYPEPGTGGAIPSRSESSLSRGQFSEAMPNEFWREVVDRVASEAPDTLLLAEAFWLMEGYFVRTLGMHRVYNSAFMHMMRDEETDKYRQVMKNTLEFDPEILKRFVNFMNNPDEDTAVTQFGKGDKYFGVCTVLATMPGLPMFGHGQFEGFSEKYGMEYRRAYEEENPDQGLIDHHLATITPLLRCREKFADVTDFRLYDLVSPDGGVNEHVLAYSNGQATQRSLIVFNNTSTATSGWINESSPMASKGEGNEHQLASHRLAEMFDLQRGPQRYAIFSDSVSGQQFLRSNVELHERGLFLELDPYQSVVFLEMDEVVDDDTRQYGNLSSYLHHRGVPNVLLAMKEALLEPVHSSFERLVRSQVPLNTESQPTGQRPDPTFVDQTAGLLEDLLHEISKLGKFASSTETASNTILLRHQAVVKGIQNGSFVQMRNGTNDQLPGPYFEITLVNWSLVHGLGLVSDDKEDAEISRSWLDEWHFGRQLNRMFLDQGMDTQAAEYRVSIVKVLTSHQYWFRRNTTADGLLNDLFLDSDVRQVVQINRHRGVLWYNKESFEEVLWWLLTVAEVITGVSSVASELDNQGVRKAMIAQILAASETAEYQVEKLMDGVAQS
jgi:glycosidase